MMWTIFCLACTIVAVSKYARLHFKIYDHAGCCRECSHPKHWELDREDRAVMVRHHDTCHVGKLGL